MYVIAYFIVIVIIQTLKHNYLKRLENMCRVNENTKKYGIIPLIVFYKFYHHMKAVFINNRTQDFGVPLTGS